MKLLLKYKFSVLTAVAIAYLSLFKTPSFDTPIAHIPNVDKIVHFIMYATLSLAMAFETKLKNKYIKILPLFIISTTFGGVIEILQSFTPTRTASWWDFLADALGSALPLVILLTIYYFYYNGRERENQSNCAESDRRNRRSKSRSSY